MTGVGAGTQVVGGRKKEEGYCSWREGRTG